MLDKKEQKVNNYTWNAESIVQKGHKIKPESANGDYYYHNNWSFHLWFETYDGMNTTVNKFSLHVSEIGD